MRLQPEFESANLSSQTVSTAQYHGPCTENGQLGGHQNADRGEAALGKKSNVIALRPTEETDQKLSKIY
jgi:hypothetical protein